MLPDEKLQTEAEKIYVDIANPLKDDPDPTSTCVCLDQAGRYYNVLSLRPNSIISNMELNSAGYYVVEAVCKMVEGRTVKLFVALEEPKK